MDTNETDKTGNPAIEAVQKAIGNLEIPDRRKNVQIQVTYTVDTDDEAMEVKKAVCEALKPWPQLRIVFNIQEGPPRFNLPAIPGLTV